MGALGLLMAAQPMADQPTAAQPTAAQPSAAQPSAGGDCEPSKWGADDEVGNANLINAASVLKAAELIKTGQTYSLGITIDSATPAFPPRGLSLTVVQPNQQGGARPLFDRSYNDDIFSGWFGIGFAT